MHVRRLIELAGILASHGPLLVDSGERPAAEGIEWYWTTSKVRLDRWAWSLRDFSKRHNLDAKNDLRHWPTTRSVLEEILASEMLTRVWTAILCACDRQRGSDDMEPVARSVMLGHMEARNRALTLLVYGTGIDTEAAIRLNRLRLRTERWTDLLLGNLVRMYDVSELAVDPRRAKDFADDLRQRGDFAGGRRLWSLISASLRAAFQSGLSPVSPNAELNARIAGSILSCFPPEAFDSIGLLRSRWLTRLADIAGDTQGLIDELLREERSNVEEGAEPTAKHHETRLRRFGG